MRKPGWPALETRVQSRGDTLKHGNGSAGREEQRAATAGDGM